MLALSLSDKFCCFGIFVLVFVNENHTVLLVARLATVIKSTILTRQTLTVLASRPGLSLKAVQDHFLEVLVLGDMVLITSLTLTVIKRECEISTVQADRLYNIAYGNVCNFKLTTTVETIANCVLNDAAATSTAVKEQCDFR